MTATETPRSLATGAYAPESELLLLTARVALDDATRDRILHLCSTQINWELLLWAAKAHGLAPLVYWHLRKIANIVPAETMQALAESYMTNACYCGELSAELIDLVDQFECLGIDVVSFKGPVLAETYYGNVAFRPTNDLDMLIAKESVSSAYRLLQQHEYSPCEWRHRHLGDQFFQSSGFANLCHEYAFLKADGSIYVDLHWQLLAFEFLSLSPADVMKHLVKRVFLGRSITAFDDELYLLFLCAHATKHAWSRVNWILDIAQVMDRMQNTNWHSFLEFSRAAGAERMVLLGVHLTKHLPMYRPVSELECRIQEIPEVTRWGDEIMDRFARNPAVREWRELKKWTFFLSMKDRWSDKVRLLLQLATRPTLDEWIRIPLPHALFSLYFVLRPLNLFWEDGVRLLWKYWAGGYDRDLNPKGD